MNLLFLPPQSETTRGWAAEVARRHPEIRTVVAEDAASVAREIGTADAAFGTLEPGFLAEAGRLRWLQAPMAAPPAGYYHPELIAHPVAVTNFRGIYNDHIAAHVMGYVLMIARGLHLTMRSQFEGVWRYRPLGEHPTVYLPGTTMLIVGLGGVGGETARLASAFGMRVIAVDARQTERPVGVEALGTPQDLDRLLPEADWVVLTVPHTPATEGFFDRRRFALMKPASTFINIGRGMTTRLDDLVDALREGRLAHAALDVFETEPLPPGHPLWTMENVILTPHMALEGPFLDERKLDILSENCRRFLDGRPLRNQVEKAEWF